MDVVRERLILELVEAALDLPMHLREAWLREKTADDPALSRESLELLQATGTVNHNLPTVLPMAVAEFDGPPPERIGRYRIGELLGRGGMGRVFAAERDDGVFEQTVAIKLMRRAVSAGVGAEQFARERQILARLQHRNIAQLFDGGVTEDGHSYFVMELAAGRTITQYVREERLDLNAKIRQFMQICAALRYAHSRLVVHADIKPNNILVTGDGSVKLLDFGVARMANAGVDAMPVPFALTREYASPMRRRGEVPTTADDVYSLGVLLEELLGSGPEIPADLHAIVRRARDENAELRYPSVEALGHDLNRWLGRRPVEAYRGGWFYAFGKLLSRHRLAATTAMVGAAALFAAAIALAVLFGRAEAARDRADQRFADARQLSHYVLFDIYDRLEGVPRALALRRDIAEAGQRYLDRLAHDPNAPPLVRLEVIEGLRRLAQVQAEPGRASLNQVAHARANLDLAAQLARMLPTDREFAFNRALVLGRVELARARIAGTSDQDFPAAQRALDAATALLDSLSPESAADAQLLALRRDIAVEQSAILQWGGKYKEAETVAQRALAQMTPAIAPTVENRALILQRARLMNIMADSIYYGGDAAGAERVYRDEYGWLEKMAAALPADMSVNRAFALSAWQLGSTLLELRRGAEAQTILAQGHELYKQLNMLEPDDRDLTHGLDIIANAHAQSLATLHRFAEAIAVLERSVAHRRQLWLDAPDNWSAARDYSIALAMLGDVRSDAGQVQLACGNYREVLETAEKIRSSGRLSQLDQEYGLRLVRERMKYFCGGTAAKTGGKGTS
ncbi:MAG: protein kinase [Pseudomonadota bacterium]